MADYQITVRSGTAASATSNNPVLLAGEIGFETDTYKYKIGDGTTAWNSLAYSGGRFTTAGLAMAQAATAAAQAALLSTGLPEAIMLDVGDEGTNLATGNAKKTFRMPFAMTLTAVRASVNTAPVGSTVIVDINEGGVTILSTKLSIDASELTSTTAATPAVISDTALASDAEITIDIDQVGSGTPGKGLKVILIGSRA